MLTRACTAADATPIFDLINTAARMDRIRGISEHVFQQEFFCGPTGAVLDRAAVAIADNSTPGGVIAGFAWWEPHGDMLIMQGWVHPNWRRQRAGTALLDAAESYARRHNFNQIAGQGYGEIPGIMPLFESRGYTSVHQHLMMTGTLIESRFEAPTPTGITLKPFSGPELEKLVEADNLFFKDHWGWQAVSAEVWRRRLIETRPHDPALWVIAWARDKNGGEQIVGECLAHASQQGGPRDGWIGIVGVHPDWRGRGLGRAVLVHGLQNLQQAGFETASLHVSSENIAALKLYQSQGMEVIRTRHHFRKGSRG